MNRQTRRAIARIYARLPKLECRGLCQQSCGPILMSAAEASAIEAYTGEPLQHVRDDISCPYLVDGRCSVYPVRPMICRLYGLSEGLPCPHGCKPVRLIPRDQAGKLLVALERLSHGDARGTMDPTRMAAPETLTQLQRAVDSRAP